MNKTGDEIYSDYYSGCEPHYKDFEAAIRIPKEIHTAAHKAIYDGYATARNAMDTGYIVACERLDKEKQVEIAKHYAVLTKVCEPYWQVYKAACEALISEENSKNSEK